MPVELLYVTQRDIECVFNDSIEENYRLDIPSRFSDLCSALFLRPGLSSRMRGAWSREDTRKLTEEEAKSEVGWFWKNCTEEERSKLSEVNASNLVNTYFHDARYLELVEESRRKLGKLRTSRMRSNYKPVSLTQGSSDES